MPELPEELPIAPRGPVDVAVRPPGSKSITNRALVAAALARGTSELSGCLVSDDTEVMLACLDALGVTIERGPEAWSLGSGRGAGVRLAVSLDELEAGESGSQETGGPAFVQARFEAGAEPIEDPQDRLDPAERTVLRLYLPLLLGAALIRSKVCDDPFAVDNR